MKFSGVAFLLTTIVGVVNGQSTWGCGSTGSFTAAGSTTVAPVTNLSSIQYVKRCKNSTISVQLGGSGVGAKRVCGDASGGTPVEIGNMSRDWKFTEANSTQSATAPLEYFCINDPTRKVIKMPVAIDGVTVVIERGGKLAACITALGGGLTSKQLRWIYSNLTNVTLLEETIANKDSNQTSRKWIELNAACPDVEIKAIAPGPAFGTNDFFKTVIFTGGATEGFRSAVKFYDDNSIAMRDQVLNVDYTIGFFGYAWYSQFDTALQALKVDGTAPTDITLADDSYQPFGRRIFSNYLSSDPAVLLKTKCFSDFTYTQAGKIAVITTNFLPIPDIEWDSLRPNVPGTCAGSPTPAPTPKPACKCFILFKLFGFCCKK